MRLWHYKLIPVLPKAMLVSQWRECIAIKRQWEKGTLKHRLVSYVKNYDRKYFSQYVGILCNEIVHRKINFNFDPYVEIRVFCIGHYWDFNIYDGFNYPEHNDRYLQQCYYNLQEKYDRGIISEEEWKNIEVLMNTLK